MRYTNLNFVFNQLFKRLKRPFIYKSVIHKKAYVCSDSEIRDSIIEKYTYISYKSTLIKVNVGSYTSIGSNVSIGLPGHPTDWVSTSPVFHSGKNVFNFHFSKHIYNPYKTTYVGNDVWIGSNVLIKAGLNIGNGSVIGMGSVVTKNIPSYEIWAGNPAKKIKDRFDSEIKYKIANSAWWNFDDVRIKTLSSDFNKIDQYIISIIGGNKHE